MFGMSWRVASSVQVIGCASTSSSLTQRPVAHLWAECFDKPLADLFEMQDEIVARLANELGTQLVVAEARRAERALIPNSTDLYYQGLALFNKGASAENLTQARKFLSAPLHLTPAI